MNRSLFIPKCWLASSSVIKFIGSITVRTNNFYSTNGFYWSRWGLGPQQTQWVGAMMRNKIISFIDFFFSPPQFSPRTQQTVLIKPWLKTEFSTFNLLNPLISYWRNLPGALPYGLLCSQHVTPWNARLQTKLTHAWVMPCFLLMGATLVHSRVAFPCPPAAGRIPRPH